MSATWNWSGNFFPCIEQSLNGAPTGDKTYFPISWDLTYNSSADNQICRFEWACSEITITVIGSCLLRIMQGGTLAYDDVPVPFSHTFTLTQDAGSSWNTREPNDYGFTAVGFLGNELDEMPYTSSWGESLTIQISYLYAMSPNLMVDETSIKPDGIGYSTYFKEQHLDITVGTTTSSPLGGGLALARFDPFSITSAVAAPVGTATLFHGSATIYGQDIKSGNPGFTFSTLSVTRTGECTQPPNI